MALTIQAVQDKIQKNDLASLNSGSAKSQLKRLIKNKKFEESIIRELWKIKGVRWELTRCQTLPNDLIDFIILNIHSPSELRQTVFNELLAHQNITKNDYLKIEKKLYLTKFYFIAWQEKYKEMMEYCDVNKLLKLFETDRIRRADDYISAAIVALFNINSIRPEILDSILSSNKNLNSSTLLILTKKFFFEDDLIDLVKSTADQFVFFNFMEKLTLYNNCSSYKKAKFLLEK